MVNLPIKDSRVLYRGVRKRIKRIGEREDPWGILEGIIKGVVFLLKKDLFIGFK